MAEAADGERIHYVWISSKSFQTRRRYLAFDLPCGDEQHPIFVTVSRTVDWTRGDFPELAPANGSTFSIEEGFLRLAAGAAGVDIDRFYKLNADGSRLLDLSSVKSLEKMSTDPDLQSCADEQRNLIF